MDFDREILLKKIDDILALPQPKHIPAIDKSKLILDMIENEVDIDNAEPDGSYNDGHSDGYDEGYSDGYDQGLEDGREETK